jgi:hypothetical protein
MMSAAMFTEINRPKWSDWKPGDRVKHVGTKQWATILEIVPQQDKTCELKVQRDKPFCEGMSNDPTWWASYHVLDYAAAAPKEEAR